MLVDVRTIPPGHSRISSDTRYRSSGLLATTLMMRSVSPAGAWHSRTSGDLPQGSNSFIEVALVELGTDGGSHTTSQGRRQDATAVGAEGPPGRRHSLEARLNCAPPGEVKFLGQHHDGHARIFVQGGEDPTVRGVEFLQSDHFLSSFSLETGQIDQSI